jgi:hypothetical protein
MNAFRTISKTAAVLSLTLLAAGLAQAQGSAPESGSTDIWATNFQRAYAGGNVLHGVQGAPTSTGSTDIWGTDFQRAFVTGSSTQGTTATQAYWGSIDIYQTDFQKAFKQGFCPVNPGASLVAHASTGNGLLCL